MYSVLSEKSDENNTNTMVLLTIGSNFFVLNQVIKSGLADQEENKCCLKKLMWKSDFYESIGTVLLKFS